jgi:multisubunit Na+/H+ antiporter MnhC subunit
MALVLTIIGFSWAVAAIWIFFAIRVARNVKSEEQDTFDDPEDFGY